MIQNEIKKLRIARDITQDKLAEIVGVSRQTIVAIEKGNYVPSLMLAMQLARFFKMPVEHLFKIS